MIIIDESDLEAYRFVVAKIAFLKVYKEYKFIEDISKSNCFIAELESKRYVISILKKPVSTLNLAKINQQIIVYYQKAQFNRNREKNNSFEIKELNDDFDKEYDFSLNQAIMKPYIYIQNNIEYEILLNEVMGRTYVVRDTSGVLYKYYSEEKVKKNDFGVNDGDISFLNPNKFNDPFDCSCVLSNNKSVSDKFRVLCTIQDPKNILMWSYYASEHKGYCFEYKKHDIITAIINSNLNGLCIIGKIHYSDKRPNYSYSSDKFSYTNIKFLIECTFTKYEKWKHEDEFRFVLVSDSFKDNGIATKMNIPILNVFNGCKGDGVPISNSHQTQINVVKLTSDTVAYKLL